MSDLQRDCSYTSGNMCGDCLHHKEAHTLHNNSGLYHCAACGKYCDPIDYNRKHKGGNVRIDMNNKFRYEVTEKPVRDNGKDKPEDVKPVTSAPVELTGR